MDRFALLTTFANGEIVTIRDANGARATGIIASIEREDGSGYCYNVKLYGHLRPVFVRCVRGVRQSV